MMALSGISISKGIAIGKAAVLRRGTLDIREYSIPESLIEDEVVRFRSALRKAKRQLRAVRDDISPDAPSEAAALLDTHIVMFDDHTLREGPVEIICSRRCNAEWALKLQRDLLMQVFEEMDDPYLRARKDDIEHVINRIQQNLQGDEGFPSDMFDHRARGAVVVADDLAPAEIMLMYKHGVAAFVTECGGLNSHTAILARSLGVPAVLGVHHARCYIHHDDDVAIEGRHGMVVVAPSLLEMDYFRHCQQEERHYRALLGKLKRRPVISRDGQTIVLMAMAEMREDARAAREAGAAGIGLFRTEMLFLGQRDLPNEAEQFDTYVRIVQAMKGAPVTIRTLDLGMDKWLAGMRPPADGGNPAMGLRAIRWCLQDPTMFSTQLRAILRASAYGPVRIMFPMLCAESELHQALALLSAEKSALCAAGVDFDADIHVGAMIEVPAAALSAASFARCIDFLSLGTNDLIQYALAVDRMDEEVNYLYDPLHPAVLKLIHMTIAAGRRAGIPVSMCGEMAGDPFYTWLLLGMGLRDFSVAPGSLLEIKRAIVDSDIALLTPKVRRILRLGSRAEIGAAVDHLVASMQRSF
ncbi:MAG: phosphoenolpyruvate--protein phosphotransferase [Chromatiales bacterium]|jgi:phosphotransferase system enzyme I (PtsI)|nr:phosphoenolpyruvate--protein phosphotransferase [Chromatiales bacterium]